MVTAEPVDFKNTVLVMTSNLGSDVIQAMAADTGSDTAYDDMKEAVMGIVSQHFRPEFLNRVDDSVVFHPLAQNQILGIAEIQLEILKARLKDNDIHLQVGADTLNFLSEVGYDPVYGARPLKRGHSALYRESPCSGVAFRQIQSRGQCEISAGIGTNCLPLVSNHGKYCT
jgi:ATP-dependent Clp protease ATP-binding subunit ClpA